MRIAQGMGEDVRHIDLDCGIAYCRIGSWLTDELSLACSGDGWTYPSRAGTCRVVIHELEPRVMGGMRLARTRLLVDGPRGAVDDFERLFTLRFMSAGG